jgi:radical SAM superfamily enzyme YgiQ (UPF0313 family)
MPERVVTDIDFSEGSNLEGHVTGLLTRLFPDGGIKKVLLVNPPDSDESLFQYETAKRGRYTNYSPYGLLLLAKNLQQIGVEVAVCNLNHEILKRCRLSEDEKSFDFDRVWKARLDEKIEGFQPDLIGVTCMFTMTHPSFKAVCEHAGRAGVPLAIGGVHVSNDVDRILGDIPCVRLAFLREGEIALNNFVNAVNGNGEVSGLGQVIITEGNAAHRFTKEVMPNSTDINVTPAWELDPPLKNAEYGTIGSFYYFKPQETRFATVLSNRGCRAQCTFCSVRNFNGAGVRQRDPVLVVDELEMLEQKYGVGHIMWLDDDLLKDESRAIALFNEMVRRNLSLTWDTTNGVIAYSCVDEVIAAASASGCIGMNIGMESGNPEILKQVRKPGTVKNFIKAAEALRKFDQIYSCVLLMVGFPGETLRMVMDTIEVAREMDLDWCRISPLQPLPNTPIYDAMVAQGMVNGLEDSEVRFQAGAYGKQAEVEQGLRLSTANFEEVFSGIGLDNVPTPDQITDIWFYMNYHLNFHRLFSEESPIKISQQMATLENLSDFVAPENGFALYFLGFLGHKVDGKVSAELIGRLEARLATSDYWKERFAAFGLSTDDLRNHDFKNKLIPRLLPKGYSGSWAA